MAATHVFPQTGDNDDAENFAQLIGQANLADFVQTGMGLTADYTNLAVDVGDGLAFIGAGSQTASSTSETRLSTNMAVQVSAATLSLTDAAVNHVYVEPDFQTDDNASYAVYTDTTNAGTYALKIGEVDTSNNTTTELNREPDITSNQLHVKKGATFDSSVSLNADIDTDATVRGRIYADNHGVGGTPNIAVAVGDPDTGLHSTTDGLLEFWNNNTKRGEMDSSGNHTIEGTYTENASL